MAIKSGKKQNQKKPICWALDPFQDNIEYHTHALKVLKPISTAFDREIHPVSFISQKQLLFSRGTRAKMEKNELTKMVTAAAQERFNQVFTPAQRKQMATLKVIIGSSENSSSLDEGLKALDAYAKRVNAAFVSLHSHARKGLKRLFLGSFAENFVLLSQTPTLLISPTCKPVSSYKTVVFATDFSRESLESFKIAIDYAKNLKAEIKIVHCLYKPKLSIFLSGQLTKQQLEDEFSQGLRQANKTADSLLAKCKAAKVKGSFELLEVVGTFEPAVRIADFIKKCNAPFVVMAAKSGQLKTRIIGATSRELARSVECPILIDRKA